MGDDIAASIKRTQEQLGKFVKKPPLTDKNLTRPPFRFLHDIVHNVIDSTGFMAGVFTPEELDAANVTSRDAKSAFMQKLIQAVKDKTGDDVPVKVSKVLAGLEADKTNGLLQTLAKAIEAHQLEGGAKKGGGAAAAAKKPGAAAASKTKAGATRADGNKKAGATVKGGTDKKDGGSGGTKRTIRDPSPTAAGGGNGGRTATKQGKTSDGGGSGSGSKSKSKALKPQATVDLTPPPASLEPNVPESVINDETVVGPTPSSPPKPLSRKESSADLVASKNKSNEIEDDVDMDNNDNVVGPDPIMPTTATSSSGYISNNISTNNDNVHDDDDDANGNNANLGLYDDNYAASSPLIKPNMQTLPPPKSPILTDADAINATITTSPTPMMAAHPLTPTQKSSSLTPTPGPSLTPSPSPLGGKGRPPSGATTSSGGPRSLSREASAEQQQSKGSPYGSASIGEIRPPTGQQQQVRSRPDTGTSGRLSSARPPSARRAPPRPKSSVVREEVEPYRPTTGKVAHVIMDNTEDADDDDNYVVREVTVTASKPPGLSDLDETPELGIMGVGILGGGGGELDSILPPDQRGLLVNQILETQKELEDKGKGGDETPMIEKKLKELSVAEIDKLKNLIQLCARSANPLAKLLDYMAEDVDSMQKEYNAYREESKRLNLELENAREDTDKFLQNLKHDLNDIERKIKDKDDAILASQMKIIQQEERIEEIVLGFERVRSGKNAQAAKDHMPAAEEILAHIQGQSGSTLLSTGSGGGGGYGVGGAPPSAFTFSSVGPSIGSTPSSAASGPANTAAAEPFKIPDSFMANGSGGGIGANDAPSPFSRGKLWSSMASNNNGGGGGVGSATFDIMNSMDEDDEQTASMGAAASRRNTGRSGGLGGGYKRSTTTMDYPLETGGGVSRSDADNFNPWS